MAEIVCGLILSVAANVIAYYIIKGFQSIVEIVRKSFARKGKDK